MTPDQLSAMVAVATILKTVGSLPFGLILVFIIVGPWIGMVIATNSISKRAAEARTASDAALSKQNNRIDAVFVEFREHVTSLMMAQDKVVIEFRDQVTAIVTAQEKRFEAVVRMYENNVEVVRNYHSLSNDLTGIITLSTRTLEGLVSKIDNNQFCPIVRKETGKS